MTQWQTPKSFPPVAAHNYSRCLARPAAPLWNTPEVTSGFMCMHGSTASQPRALEITQDGTKNACGLEYDSFLGPNGSPFPDYPTGCQPSPPLSSLMAVNVSVGLQLLNLTVKARCGHGPLNCGPAKAIDYGYGVIGIVAQDVQTKSTLFYQIQMGDTRDNIGCPGFRSTNSTSKTLNWYSRTKPYGASHPIGSFGYPPLKMSNPSPGTTSRLFINVDVLPRLKMAILDPVINGSLPNWRVTSAYVGVGLIGSVRQTIVIDSFDLTVDQPSS